MKSSCTKLHTKQVFAKEVKDFQKGEKDGKQKDGSASSKDSKEERKENLQASGQFCNEIIFLLLSA